MREDTVCHVGESTEEEYYAWSYDNWAADFVNIFKNRCLKKTFLSDLLTSVHASIFAHNAHPARILAYARFLVLISAVRS